VNKGKMHVERKKYPAPMLSKLPDALEYLDSLEASETAWGPVRNSDGDPWIERFSVEALDLEDQ